MREVHSLEAAYLAHADPIRQCGFSAGAERWRAERGPILDAVDRDGDLLDMGCANGYLAECLTAWAAAERGVKLIPHGVDIGPGLIRLARQRLPPFADNFHVGNVWDWTPPRRYAYTCTRCGTAFPRDIVRGTSAGYSNSSWRTAAG